MRLFLITIFIAGALIFSAQPAFAINYPHCPAPGQAGCSADECGAFMCGISRSCTEDGDCQLNDIITVFCNVGNFGLGLAATLVFLMYVIGGMYLLAAGGNQERITKGKNYLKTSTIGLLIVFFAYIGVHSVVKALGTSDSFTKNFGSCTIETLK